MKKSLLLLCFVAMGTLVFAQTKRIAFRSHSGKGKMVTTTEDNYGNPPMHREKIDTPIVYPATQKKDSVKAKIRKQPAAKPGLKKKKAK